jgi:Raf kinase inhibitor-like YbhB/YbcL family protein
LENARKETKLFAVTMYDLDALTGSALWHWMVYNIPPSAKSFVSDSGSFTENKLPKGATNGLNDIGVRGYFGACPPEGQLHKYIITVYALNNIIQVILLK